MDPVRRKPPELTGDLAVAYEGYREGLIHSWSQTLSVLGFSLNALFLLLDVVIVPSDLLGRFAVYRAVVTAALLVQYFVLRRTRPGRWSLLPGYIASVLFAVMISRMTVDLGGFDSPYYAGLNLVIVGVNVLLPWRPFHSLVNGLAVLGTYVFTNAMFGGAFAPGRARVEPLLHGVDRGDLGRDQPRPPPPHRERVRAARGARPGERRPRPLAPRAQGGARRALGRDGGREANPDLAPAPRTAAWAATTSPRGCCRPPRWAATTTTSSRPARTATGSRSATCRGTASSPGS